MCQITKKIKTCASQLSESKLIFKMENITGFCDLCVINNVPNKPEKLLDTCNKLISRKLCFQIKKLVIVCRFLHKNNLFCQILNRFEQENYCTI